MPNSNRPPDSTDSVCASHAASRGGRSGLASTNAPTCSAVVAPAAIASAGSEDSNWVPSGISSVEYPSSSARLAVASHAAPCVGTACTPNRNGLLMPSA